jgi:hypothetical protein
METAGIKLIAKERDEQLTKHNRTIKSDVYYNPKGQLSVAAGILAQMKIPEHIKDTLIPLGWDPLIWDKMMGKPYKERLVIAGALIAAEIDRLLFIE